MARIALFLLFLLKVVTQATSQAPDWGQCGGIGFTGPTTCLAGWVCTYSNPYHSQCLQPSTITITPTYSPTPTSTYTPESTLSPAPGWGYVDGDNTTIYYLQSQILNTASRAVFGAAMNASQVQISYGQLVQNALGMTLYATPEIPSNSTVTTLAVWWSTESAADVTFSLEVDLTIAVQIPGVENPGFLLCLEPDGDYYSFYINLQNEVTPSGCINETLLTYFGSIVV